MAFVALACLVVLGAVRAPPPVDEKQTGAIAA
jgi:hypothetical protein